MTSDTPDLATSDSPPRIDGVALDMDGLLFDTERLYWEVGDAVLQRRGHRFSHELQQRMMGRVGVAAMQQMVDFHSLSDSATELLIESDDLYGRMLVNDITPMPGLENWIELLVKTKTPFGLATSSRRKFVDIILETIPWRDRMVFVLTGDDVINGKPHPEMYIKAAGELAIETSQMLVLEDSQNGCAAAVAAGAYTVAIPNQHTRGQSFADVNRVVDSLSDSRLWELIRR